MANILLSLILDRKILKFWAKFSDSKTINKDQQYLAH